MYYFCTRNSVHNLSLLRFLRNLVIVVVCFARTHAHTPHIASANVGNEPVCFSACCYLLSRFSARKISSHIHAFSNHHTR